MEEHENIKRRKFLRAVPPKEGNKKERCLKFCYNKNGKLWCGRTCPSWFRILLYYIMFVILLTIMFTLFILYLYRVYYQSDMPAVKKIFFMDGAYPAATIVPVRLNLLSNTIWYTFKGEDALNNRRASAYINAIEKRFDEEESFCYDNETCMFERSSLGPCGEKPFGYDEKQPCVYLKLNKLEDWKPDAYNSKDNIPDAVSDELKKVIDVHKPKVWVECGGTTVYSNEKIGKLDYFPGQSYDGHYFPLEQKSKHAPMVAIKLTNLQVGFLVQLKCSVHAKNIAEGNNYAKIFVYVDIEK